MAVYYKKHFHVVIEKEINNAQLAERAGISANIITRLKRNTCISIESVEKSAK